MTSTNCLSRIAWAVESSTGRLKEDVHVLVRILEKPDPQFMRQVTLHTNSQNAVRAADLVGTDPIQLQLKRDLERMGYYYETRRGEFHAEYQERSERVAAFGDDYKSKVLKLLYGAQAYAAFYAQIPVIAKKNTTYLFLSKADGGRYEDVFNSSTTASKLLGAAQLMKRITQRRRDIVAGRASGPSPSALKWLPHADHFILALFYHRFFDPDATSDDAYVEDCFNFAQGDFDRLHEETVAAVSGHIAKKSRSRGYDHVKYFKSEAGYIELSNLFDTSGRYPPRDERGVLKARWVTSPISVETAASRTRLRQFERVSLWVGLPPR